MQKKQILRACAMSLAVCSLVLGGVGCKNKEEPSDVHLEKQQGNKETQLLTQYETLMTQNYGIAFKGTVSGDALKLGARKEVEPLLLDEVYVNGYYTPTFLKVEFFEQEGGAYITEVIANDEGTYWDVSGTVLALEETKEIPEVSEKFLREADYAKYVAYTDACVGDGEAMKQVILSVLSQATEYIDLAYKSEEGEVLELKQVDFAELGDSKLEQVIEAISGDCRLSSTQQEDGLGGTLELVSDALTLHWSYEIYTKVTPKEEPYAMSSEEYQAVIQRVIEIE